MKEPFSVVFVCTGNQARSPLAEALYRHYTEGVATVVTSFGTSDVGAAPPLPQALEAAASVGVDLSNHRARALRRGDLDGVDLVLGFEPFHQAVAVVEGGASAANTLLLAELVSLLGDVPLTDADDTARARSVVAVADSRRARSRPAADTSIADPLGQPDEVMFRIAEQIDEHVRRLVDGLFGVSESGSNRLGAD